jgi:hypothetical protein
MGSSATAAQPCRPWVCELKLPTHLPHCAPAGHLLRMVDPTTGAPLTDAQLKAEISTVFGAVSSATGWGCMGVGACLGADGRVPAPAALQR